MYNKFRYMKKMMFVISLMTISLLTNCGNNKYALTATCVNGTVSGNQGKYEKNEEVELIFIAKQDFDLPTSIDDITFTGIDKSAVSYNGANGILTFKMPANIVSVTVTATTDVWYLDETYINGLSEDDVGITQTLRVNGIDQTIRLIGVDHDELSNGLGKAHTTWEFANLLSDNDGYSLATPWNWEQSGSSINQDYIDSNLRKAFDGYGDAQLYWYRKGQGTSEQTQQTEYANKTVLDMFPSNLQTVIKEVKKPIATTSSYTINSYNTKVFPLSYKEMTKASSSDAKTEGTTYKFYADNDSNKSRLKYQVKQSEGAATDSTDIADGKRYEAYNYAGYNVENEGGISWLRSPYLGNSFRAWGIESDGSFVNNSISKGVFAIAPAFCI